MNSTVTAVAVHTLVCVVDGAADEARFGVFEQGVVDDQSGVDVRDLRLVFDSIGVYDRAIDIIFQFHLVELRSAYWTAVCALNPGFEAAIVEIVFAWKEMCDALVVDVSVIVLSKEMVSTLVHVVAR